MPKFIVKSTRDSFRRGGIEFTRDGVTVDTSKLTDAQIESINAEPLLFVHSALDDKGAPLATTKEGKLELVRDAKKQPAK